MTSADFHMIHRSIRPLFCDGSVRIMPPTRSIGMMILGLPVGFMAYRRKSRGALRLA